MAADRFGSSGLDPHISMQKNGFEPRKCIWSQMPPKQETRAVGNILKGTHKESKKNQDLSLVLVSDAT